MGITIFYSKEMPAFMAFPHRKPARRWFDKKLS